MKIHHIGYLVKNIEKAQKGFEDLGYEAISEVTHDEIRGVDIMFMKNGGYCIELVSPFTKDSVTAGLMKTHRNSPYHICYEVDNIDKASKEYREKGFVKMDDPTPAPAFDGKKVCFLLSAKVGMIELLERE